jgi:hypothetical protein
MGAVKDAELSRIPPIYTSWTPASVSCKICFRHVIVKVKLYQAAATARAGEELLGVMGRTRKAGPMRPTPVKASATTRKGGRKSRTCMRHDSSLLDGSMVVVDLSGCYCLVYISLNRLQSNFSNSHNRSFRHPQELSLAAAAAGAAS